MTQAQLAASTQPTFLTARNRHGQILIISAADAGKRLVEASWYDGGIYSSAVVAVESGETDEQAALRQYGARIADRYLDTLTVRDTGIEVCRG